MIDRADRNAALTGGEVAPHWVGSIRTDIAAVREISRQRGPIRNSGHSLCRVWIL